ncbi:Uncharacterized protein BM_BM17414 [Brugia malayi]|uniref:Uncharacterized protein n=1 Tax=Brugia malayi TaxID=6279 RepID=A0A4E9F7X7_BRUMA|nr:Uncharacterized protein BM_BM17414 [Brugia malayi]VIO92420.1 Uncharacterized protein BM_BM17414 [Brugia malayi]
MMADAAYLAVAFELRIRDGEDKSSSAPPPTFVSYVFF